MSTRLGLRSLSAVAVALGLLSAASSASAQEGGTSSSGYGVALTTQAVPRFYPNGKPYPFRDANLNPNDINFQDCEDDIVLQFNLTESGLGTTSSPDILQIWAGTTDCTQPTARAGAESPFCWQVGPAQQPTLTATVNISARSLTQYVDTTLTSVPNGGNPIFGTGLPESACHTQTSSGEVGVSIYFMFLPNTGDATPDASTSYSLNVDLVGPLAPTSLTAGIGDGILLINWTPQVDPTIQGFDIYAEDQGPNGLGVGGEAGAAVLSSPIYCKSSGGVTTCPDADVVDGAVDDATVDSGACTTTYPDGSAYTEMLDASSLASLSDASLASMGCERSFPTQGITTGALGTSSCTSTVLVNTFSSNVTETTYLEGGVAEDGAVDTVSTLTEGGAVGLVGISQIDYALYGVGNVGGNTTSSYTVENIPYADGGGSGRLIDGHQYAVAVAAYDQDGNVGLLSPLACQTPEPITDFWDKYEEDGGLAGGGFCSLEGPGGSALGTVVSFGMVATAIAYVRRRRRKS